MKFGDFEVTQVGNLDIILNEGNKRDIKEYVYFFEIYSESFNMFEDEGFEIISAEMKVNWDEENKEYYLFEFGKSERKIDIEKIKQYMVEKHNKNEDKLREVKEVFNVIFGENNKEMKIEIGKIEDKIATVWILGTQREKLAKFKYNLLLEEITSIAFYEEDDFNDFSWGSEKEYISFAFVEFEKGKMSFPIENLNRSLKLHFLIEKNK